ncbi:MAG: helix-turn-helix transcriptional regulator [Tissierellia bacterium]|nr:helix-turn-helix transcriptional regulator [Tissierellia bacterium]
MEREIGKRIRAFREEKGLSQLKLVEELKKHNIKMSRETLSKIENSSRSISALELKAISTVLGVDIGDFFQEEEESMVTFFRKRNFPKNALEEISKLQEMVKVFIDHEKMYKE